MHRATQVSPVVFAISLKYIISDDLANYRTRKIRRHKFAIATIFGVAEAPTKLQIDWKINTTADTYGSIICTILR